MIFVTVGMHSQGFERLIKKMDEVAGKIDEEVIMQIGHIKYEPKNASWFCFKNIEEIEELIKKSRLIVCHAGVGSIISSLQEKKPLLLVPRMKKYKEAIDDHQLEIAKALKENNGIRTVYDVSEIEALLKDFDTKPIIINTEREKLITSLKTYIDMLEKTRKER